MSQYCRGSTKRSEKPFTQIQLGLDLSPSSDPWFSPLVTPLLSTSLPAIIVPVSSLLVLFSGLLLLSSSPSPPPSLRLSSLFTLLSIFLVGSVGIGLLDRRNAGLKSKVVVFLS